MKLPELVIGAVVGAGLMALFDPRAGLRRRPILRDLPATRLDPTRVNVNERLHDAAGDLRREEAAACDETLCARVSAALERKITYAQALQVEVADGCATLRGSVMAGDLLPVLTAARAVPGVDRVDSRLDVHYTTAHAPDFSVSNARVSSML